MSYLPRGGYLFTLQNVWISQPTANDNFAFELCKPAGLKKFLTKTNHFCIHAWVLAIREASINVIFCYIDREDTTIKLCFLSVAVSSYRVCVRTQLQLSVGEKTIDIPLALKSHSGIDADEGVSSFLMANYSLFSIWAQTSCAPLNLTIQGGGAKHNVYAH